MQNTKLGALALLLCLKLRKSEWIVANLKDSKTTWRKSVCELQVNSLKIKSNEMLGPSDFPAHSINFWNRRWLKPFIGEINLLGAIPITYAGVRHYCFAKSRLFELSLYDQSMQQVGFGKIHVLKNCSGEISKLKLCSLEVCSIQT